MTRDEQASFELYVMVLAENCKTGEDFRKLSEELHESIENAVQEMCWDLEIDDYDPPY